MKPATPLRRSKRSDGFTIIETLVMGAVGLALMVAIATMFTHMTRQGRRVSLGQEFTSLGFLIQGILNSPAACTNAFQGQSFVPDGVNPTVVLALPGGGQIGNNTIYSGWKTTVALEDLKLGNAPYIAKLTIGGSRQDVAAGEMGKAMAPMYFPLHWNGATISCAGVATSPPDMCKALGGTWDATQTPPCGMPVSAETCQSLGGTWDATKTPPCSPAVALPPAQQVCEHMGMTWWPGGTKTCLSVGCTEGVDTGCNPAGVNFPAGCYPHGSPTCVCQPSCWTNGG